VAPQQARGFVFSLKQSGAPLGGVVAGLLVPTMVAHVGWQGAIMVTVAIAFTTVVAVQPLRSRLDDDRDPSAPIAFSSPWHAVRMVLQHARLRRLILVAFFLTSTQATVMTFLVIFLVQEVKLELALAGAIFACSQAAGALLRVIFGWLSDKALGARPTLVALGIGSSVALVSLALLGPGSPAALVIGLSVAVGALSFGWNGVFLAEVANLAGPTQVGTATGGSLFFLYGGLVFGPIVMSSLITLTGGFTVPFYCVAGPTIIASLNLLRPTPSATSTK
jgi:sugar phosphate permease